MHLGSWRSWSTSHRSARLRRLSRRNGRVVPLGRVKGKANIPYPRLGGRMKEPQPWWAQCPISNPTPTPIVVATWPRIALPSEVGASTLYGHEGHIGNNGHDGHDGHSSIKRFLVIQCQIVNSVQYISQVEALLRHGYDAILQQQWVVRRSKSRVFSRPTVGSE